MSGGGDAGGKGGGEGAWAARVAWAATAVVARAVVARVVVAGVAKIQQRERGVGWGAGVLDLPALFQIELPCIRNASSGGGRPRSAGHPPGAYGNPERGCPD